jgi:DNA-binding FadR family transcriptional regulator
MKMNLDFLGFSASRIATTGTNKYNDMMNFRQPRSDEEVLELDPFRTFERITAQPLYERVVQQLARQILNGSLPPGSSLPVENELAREFGVSRTVVREAVRVLAAKGLVSVRQGSGMRVAPAEQWNHLDPLVLFGQVRSGHQELLDEMLELRRLLEVEIAALAARRRGQDDLEALIGVLADMRQVRAEPVKFTELDVTFHGLILVAARNRLLREALRPVAAAIQGGRFLTMRLPGGIEGSMRGHEVIYQAIERQDEEAARAAMLEHVQRFEHNMRVGLGSQ